MATTGTYISAAGHSALVLWLVMGWGFSADPLPFEVAEVSVVSGEEYAALVAATTPVPDLAEPTAPPVPEEDAAPEAATPEQAATEQPEPEVVIPPQDDAPPPEPPAPIDPPAPPVEEVPELQPAPETAEAIDAPISEAPPSPRPAQRVAPEPVAPPPDDVALGEIDRPAEAPVSTETPTPEPEPEEAEAPEAAATEIVTEADEPSGQLASTIRPVVRPSRPAATPDPEPQENPDAADDPVAAALAEALTAPAAAPSVPQGPPMTGSEREGFRVAVNRCWNVDPGSEAARATVVVGFSLSQEGRVEGDVRLVSAQGGSDTAQRTAFEAARRAILRCQSGGYDLPVEKYGQWKDVEITFDPTGMRLR